MSYTDVKDKSGTKTSTIKCDHRGCTKKFSAENRGKAWQKAKDAGWLLPRAAEAYCDTHREEHGGRAPKAEKSAAKSKGKKSKAPKSGKAKGKLTEGGRVWNVNLND